MSTSGQLIPDIVLLPTVEEEMHSSSPLSTGPEPGPSSNPHSNTLLNPSSITTPNLPSSTPPRPSSDNVLRSNPPSNTAPRPSLITAPAPFLNAALTSNPPPTAGPNPSPTTALNPSLSTSSNPTPIHSMNTPVSLSLNTDSNTTTDTTNSQSQASQIQPVQNDLIEIETVENAQQTNSPPQSGSYHRHASDPAQEESQATRDQALGQEGEGHIPHNISYNGTAVTSLAHTQAGLRTIPNYCEGITSQLRMSRDSIPFVFNKKAFPRPSGNPEEMAFDEVQARARITGGVTRLGDLLNVIEVEKGTNGHILFDLKSRHHPKAVFVGILQEIQRNPNLTRDWRNQIAIGIPDINYLQDCRTLFPRCQVLLNCRDLGYARRHIQRLPESTFHLKIDCDILMSPQGSKFLRFARENNRKTFAAKVNKDAQMKWCIRQGIWGVVSSRVTNFEGLCQEFKVGEAPWTRGRLLGKTLIIEGWFKAATAQKTHGISRYVKRKRLYPNYSREAGAQPATPAPTHPVPKNSPATTSKATSIAGRRGTPFGHSSSQTQASSGTNVSGPTGGAQQRGASGIT